MSSSDQHPPRDAERRKFDEVASLFGSIVPPAGSPVRLRGPRAPASLPQVADAALRPEAGPKLAPPPTLRAPAEPPQVPSPGPPPVPKVDPVRLAVSRPEPERVERRAKPRSTKPVERPRRAASDVPWPDAFAPRPNYRSTGRSRLWYWLFLIPFAAVVAAAITLVDPRSIRGFIDETLPRYLPAEVTQFFNRGPVTLKPEMFPPVLPPPSSAPSPTVPPSAAPSSASPPAADAPAAEPQPVAPVVSPPEPAPAAVPPVVEQASPPAASPAADNASPAPAPTPPQEVPAAAAPVVSAAPAASAATEPAAPPPAVAAPVAAAAPRVTIYYRRHVAAAESEARRLASKAGNAEIKPSTSTARTPMIYYFNAADRDAAAALARTLSAESGPGWTVRAGPSRSSAGAIDVLLP